MFVGIGETRRVREAMTLRFHTSVKVLFANFTADDAETSVVHTLRPFNPYKL